jgi:hypothetical protein
MGMESVQLLKIFSEVAGIGGLGMGLFLLVVREVLKKVNPPDRPSAKQFYLLLNRIILFSFILAVLGLVIYAAIALRS